MATSNVSLKLLVDKKSNKVLFAEANKEFVDFLFNILSLPVGTIVNLLTKKGMIGCIGNLYESIENLSTNYLQPNLNKNIILKPKVVIGGVNANLLLPNVESSSTIAKKFYRCPNYDGYTDCYMYVTNDPSVICPSCRNTMTANATLVALPVSNTTNSASSSLSSGFVKGVVTYTVMDDLVVKPMSTISGITMLSTFDIKDIGSLEEKEISFGMEEAVKLLKAFRVEHCSY